MSCFVKEELTEIMSSHLNIQKIMHEHTYPSRDGGTQGMG